MTAKILNLGMAISDPTRLRVLMLLRQGELSASSLQIVLKCNFSTLSHHLKTLEEIGLIKRRRDGKWHFFALPRKSDDPEVFEWLKLILAHLTHDSIYASDLKSLKNRSQK